ncbi:MAG: hypothetical protein QXS42_02960 [Zestosphaera sp.]
MKYRRLLTSLTSGYVRAVECRGIEPSVGRPDIRQHLVNTVRSLQTSEWLRRDLSYYTNLYKRFIKETLKAPYSKTGYSPEVLAKVLTMSPFARLKNDVEGLRYIAELRTYIPTVVLDRDRVSYPLMLRKALRHEVVPRFKSDLVLSGCEVVLADAANRVMYVLFSKVSRMHAVSRDTRNITVISFGIPDLPKYSLGKAVREFRDLVEMYYPDSVCVDVKPEDLRTIP